jgi:hypothetical protein
MIAELHRLKVNNYSRKYALKSFLRPVGTF